MSINVYIYYRLAEAHQEAALVPAHDVLRAGSTHAKHAQLQRRPDSNEGMATWMEVYEDVSSVPDLLRTLEEAVTRNQLDSYLSSPRMAEHFVPLPPTSVFSE